ncbi:hypothetical protein R1sor_027037 [Riccia sorocarpa]|uniref:Reverse transcriptase domain-containing protein n=1 Tax=Riccia sorocarpa TaxID=122646 RepID=A0ABD3GIU9_9MARC
MAWGRTRKIFKEFHKEDREKVSKLREQKIILEGIREKIQEEASAEDRENLRVQEKLVHDTELLEASILRRRSRVRWVQEGDANNKYFYSCLKSKQLQEKITTLENDQGTRIEDEDGKLELVHSYYQNLYSQRPEAAGDREERAEVLDLIDRGVSAQDNEALEKMPDDKEITEMVESLPREKAPGEDGLTAETGFVEGRSIMDNVLSLKMCQDLSRATGEPAVFCKLDFKKAFDRVKHSFL